MEAEVVQMLKDIVILWLIKEITGSPLFSICCCTPTVRIHWCHVQR
jgi:hypothetical protein